MYSVIYAFPNGTEFRGYGDTRELASIDARRQLASYLYRGSDTETLCVLWERYFRIHGQPTVTVSRLNSIGMGD
jgi:hypothetical protein